MKKAAALATGLLLLAFPNCRLSAQPAASLDPSFVPTTAFSDVFWGLAIQPDNQILVCGRENTVPPYSQTFLGVLYRLQTNGTVDPSFRSGPASCPDATVPQISTLSLYTNGGASKILLGGAFTAYNNGINDVARPRLAQIDSATLKLDTNFTPSASGAVMASAVQNGQVIIGGNFLNFQGSGKNYLVRLNLDGTTDTNFNPGATLTGPNGVVRSVLMQPDGYILIGGDFTAVNNSPCLHIARLDKNGAVDPSFDSSHGPDDSVYAIAYQTNDSKIIIGGYLMNVGAESHSRIARMNKNGSVDSTFTASCDSYVWTLAIQSNGQILAGGRFNNVGNTYGVNTNAQRKLARFNGDGTVDPAFNNVGLGTGASDEIRALKIQNDGKILVAGKFTQFNGASCYGVARLMGDPVVPPTNQSPVTIDGLANQSVFQGTNVTFVASISDNNPPYTYQWYFVDGSLKRLVAGTTNTPATTNSLTVTNVQTSGTYSIVVNDSTGSNYTSSVVLNVYSLTAQLVQTATGFELTFPTNSAQTWVVETATNLAPPASWLPMATNSPNGVFIDSDTNHPQRFYRVHLR